ncbi:elongation factor G [Terrimonas sp.]|uniref:elongation factor G n=1 Tax=Terrimonas sp. TaxID=1914338 RepID=UPI000D50997C|nr:elongation factor G [Terrimonas sp.]PVD53673.1 elongation factor G [Terrimonas sp.]
MAAEFDTSHVKNIVLLGHAGSGKTALAECLLFEAGLITRRGTIAEKNTVGDYHELEQERGNTIFSKLMHTKWRGYKINIIDTPGYDDFSGEVLSALRVADTGIMLLNAAMGVEVGTDIIWQYTEQFKTPMIFAVNHLDNESADFDATVQEAKQHFGNKITIIQYPLQQGEGFHCIIDVLRMTMYKFKDAGGKPEKLPIPDSEREKADQLHKELIEAVAGNDETLMEKYFEKGELDEDEIKTGMKKAMINHDLFPLFCLSAERNMGCGRLMGFIDNVCPSANEMPAQVSVKGEPVACNAASPVCAFVFKSVSESHVGDLSFLKIFSGTLKTGMELINETTGAYEKINQLYVVEGNKRINVNELSAGDIGATLKLKNTHVNNTLHEKNSHYELQSIAFPPANMSIAISSQKKGEEEKLASALHQLREEDPTIIVEVSPELKQTILHCQGDMHLAVIKWKLLHQYKVDVTFTDPRIPYRETIQTAAEAIYRHKKQSGGAGQFGEVHMRIEPWYENMPDPQGLNVRGREVQELPWGGKLAFYNCIVGGAIDQRFLPSILKGVMEKMQEGPLTGSHVRDIRVSVFDGRMHPVDSNDISFKIAGLMAFKNAFQLSAPQLLEPIEYVEILCPENITGAVIGDLQTRRAIIEGINVEGNFTKVIAKVPLAEMNDYSSALRSLTQGRAKFTKRFFEYAVVPYETQKKLTESYSKLSKEEMVG